MAAWKPALMHLLDVVRHVGEVLAPGAIGAAVGQMWERGLSLRQRLIQWGVGMSCAVFIVPGMGHVFRWDQPVVNAVGFVVGTLAFKAVPKLREAFIDGAGEGLRRLPELIPGLGPKAPETPEGEG